MESVEPIRMFAAMQISTQMCKAGITTDGNANNAYEYFIQISRKVHKLCTFPNHISKVDMQPLHNGQDLRDDMIGQTRPSG